MVRNNDQQELEHCLRGHWALDQGTLVSLFGYLRLFPYLEGIGGHISGDTDRKYLSLAPTFNSIIDYLSYLLSSDHL